MIVIKYNSWSTDFKKPFGAVQVGTEVAFKLDITDVFVKEATLVMYQDDYQNYQEQQLVYQYDTQDFKTQIKLQQPGLYFYYFKIVYLADNIEKTCYYGSFAQGGWGQIYQQVQDVQTYQLTCFKQPARTPKWYQEGIFYQIFPDRFANGNPHGEINSPKKNSFLYATQEDDPYYIVNKKGEIVRWDFFGGNFKGIMQKIPYLKKLGVTGIYLNPIFEASSNHRYDTSDYLKIDAMLGTQADFEELLSQLHAADIRVILDGVFNHVGQNSRYFNARQLYGPQEGATQNLQSPYYSWFDFEKYPTKYASWWGISDLPTIKKDCLAYQNFIAGTAKTSVLSYWNQFQIDGWRLDVVDELTPAFVHKIRQNLAQYPEKVLLGEVWEDASNKMAYGQRRDYIQGDNLHGVMNYPLRQAILDIFSNDVNLADVCQRMMSLRENYPWDFYLNSLNNLGTHDTVRIKTALQNNQAKLKLAFLLLFILPGVPCLYYGDEVGLTGGKDPDNRKFYPWGREDHDLLAEVQSLSLRRQQESVLRTGDLCLYNTEHLILIGRYQAQKAQVYVINPTEKTVQDEQTLWSYHDELQLAPLLKEKLQDIKLAPYEYQVLEFRV